MCLSGAVGLFACERCQVSCAFGLGLLLHSVSLERVSHQYWETSGFPEGHSRVGEERRFSNYKLSFCKIECLHMQD